MSWGGGLGGGDGGLGGARGARYFVSVKSKGAALLGEDGASRHAVKQARAKLVFQLLYLHGHGGLRIPQFLGSFGEGALLNNGEKGLNFTQLHQLPPRLRL